SHRRLLAGRFGRHDPHRVPRERRCPGRSDRQGPSGHRGARALLAMRPRPRDRPARGHVDGRRRSSRRRPRARVLAMRPGWALALVVLLALLATPAAAADWGQIRPATTTQSEVRGRYGAPTRETAQKIEGYDAVQWLYDGAQAPAGINKMIVDFGI